MARKNGPLRGPFLEGLSRLFGWFGPLNGSTESAQSCLRQLVCALLLLFLCIAELIAYSDPNIKLFIVNSN